MQQKTSHFPLFSTINPELIENELKEILNKNREIFKKLLNQKEYSWENLMTPIEEMEDHLGQFWSPISHMHSVLETDALRQAYQKCLPLLTEYHTDILQNHDLYLAIKSIAEQESFKKLKPAQQKIISNDLRDFRLSGVHLDLSSKKRYAELVQQLSQLTTKFSENLLDATHAWSLEIKNIAELKGLPEQTLKLMKQTAEQKGQDGWLVTIDYPCYSTVMKYAENRELRKIIYEAYNTRASDKGPYSGKFDNTQIMEDILQARHELANLLGFQNYAEYSLQTKMAKNPDKVLSFLHDLVEKSKPMAKKEINEILQLAKDLDQLTHLEAWDLAYYSEKLRIKKYAISQEELRTYFPINKVLPGMFQVIKKLYGLSIVEKKNLDVWHPHVQVYEVFDKGNCLRGLFYVDLFARPHKRDGAWMDECRVRRKMSDGNVQLPIAFLTCNFMPPVENHAALLTHDDVITLFHEFGHCLHHLMSKVDYPAVSGIHGVPWDAVEFPSQFLEFWCWDKEVISMLSSHETTHESLPADMLDKMLAAKNFQSGMQMIRQLEFSLFDFRLHAEYSFSKRPFVQKILDEVREEVSVYKVPDFNRFQHSFSHIFAGGYAAGYYSYKWAEVLASDAFSLFEEKGIFNYETGQAFLKEVLEQGGVREPMDLYIAFRGREPNVDALLRHNGLSS